ncbi:hypothetical protein ACSQ67_006935 [Phaseolus vulgaris]
MGLDQSERGVSQHRNVDQSRFGLGPACKATKTLPISHYTFCTFSANRELGCVWKNEGPVGNGWRRYNSGLTTFLNGVSNNTTDSGSRTQGEVVSKRNAKGEVVTVAKSFGT